MDWKLMKGREKYHAYLASRDWALLKKQVRERADGKCEKCGSSEHLSTHHLTYARIYKERLEDLQLLCEKCHGHESGEPETAGAETITDLYISTIRPKSQVDKQLFLEAPRSSVFDVQAFIIDYMRIAFDPLEYEMDEMLWDCRNLIYFNGSTLQMDYAVHTFEGEKEVIVVISHVPLSGARHIQIRVSDDGKRRVEHLGDVK